VLRRGSFDELVPGILPGKEFQDAFLNLTDKELIQCVGIDKVHLNQTGAQRVADALLAFERGVDKFALLGDIGCAEWFEAGYIASQHEKSLPTMALRVIDIRPLGDRPVYDVSVVENSAFFANGLAAHNCMVRNLIQTTI